MKNLIKIIYLLEQWQNKVLKNTYKLEYKF